ncbi:branched-chain amino acid ABC transporter permease [Haloquadratum walsbyi]|jgi:ABC-type branched-chain amino acid transport system, permease component|uniref:ABC-type branched-chain amino acid transport system, permease component n=1 Tax=Haloquadratum walsbyi J07HQW2 TaxID=1238425 RepID=U1MX41_9EURY|nr:branched-chain amino acid ABC transporter permease [Haloquadratum walsbyi]ERG95019.1 MAG: ABC-type branched-chain amino acid transport system, permease component [Haloquadratum walsbyi J07HQW2]
MAVADVVVSFMLLVSIYGILALGLNVKYGHTGLLDFGHVGFYLIGAYTSALFVLGPDDPTDFTVYVIGLGDIPILGSWVTAILAGTILAGIVGGLVTLPTIRLREDYLAITVLGISVIFQRVIQSETWLANGPDALRGYSPPLQGSFPVTGETIVGAVLLGLIVFVAWGLTTAVLGMISTSTLATATSMTSDKSISSSRFRDRLYNLTTFGFTRADAIAQQVPRAAAVAGTIAGILAAVTVFTAGITLAVGVIVSLYTWIVAAVAIREHYVDLPQTAITTGVVLGTGLLLALIPLPILKAVGLKIIITVSALAALVGVYYYTTTRIDVLSNHRLAIIGVGSLWFISLWYFVLPTLGPLGSGDIAGATQTLFQNIVWLLRFGGDVGVGYAIVGIGELTVKVDYPRFQLAGFVLFFVGLYAIVERTVESPFGRVLRAIRNDETVVKSLGKNPFTYKLQSMVIGSALGGFAGALWAMYAQGLTFTTFAPRVTFITLLIMFVGGAGNNKGMIVGAALFWAFQQATTQLAAFFPPAIRVNIQSFRLVVVGVLFLIVLYYLPEGLLGSRTNNAATTATTDGDSSGPQRAQRTEMNSSNEADGESTMNRNIDSDRVPGVGTQREFEGEE